MWSSLAAAVSTRVRVPAQTGVTAETVTLVVPALMAALVAALLYVLRPPTDRRTVLALTPWMVVGGAVHALYTAGVYPASFSLRPFFGPRTVYFTTFVAAGMVWAMMSTAARLADGEVHVQYLAAAGTGAALTAVAIVLGRTDQTATIVPVFGGLVGAALLAAVVYLLVTVVHTTTLVQTGLLGLVVVFGHALDGTVAAVGVELLDRPGGDAGSEWLLARGGAAVGDLLGAGWLLVPARLGVAVLAVVTVAVVLDRPGGDRRDRVGHVLLGAVAAVGLGPGVHRFLVLLL